MISPRGIVKHREEKRALGLNVILRDPRFRTSTKKKWPAR